MSEVNVRLRLFAQEKATRLGRTLTSEELRAYETFTEELGTVISEETMVHQQIEALWLLLGKWITWLNEGVDQEERLSRLNRCVYITPVVAGPEDRLSPASEKEEETSNVVALWQ